jgi:hypothetical protein
MISLINLSISLLKIQDISIYQRKTKCTFPVICGLLSYKRLNIIID